MIPRLNMPRVGLLPLRGDSLVTSCGDLVEDRVFCMAVYASDNEENHALPKVQAAVVGEHQVYLPIIVR